jgi:hypothetical protein
MLCSNVRCATVTVAAPGVAKQLNCVPAPCLLPGTAQHAGGARAARLGRLSARSPHACAWGRPQARRSGLSVARSGAPCGGAGACGGPGWWVGACCRSLSKSAKSAKAENGDVGATAFRHRLLMRWAGCAPSSVLLSHTFPLSHSFSLEPAGACLALGLKFAGSANADAHATLCSCLQELLVAKQQVGGAPVGSAGPAKGRRGSSLRFKGSSTRYSRVQVHASSHVAALASPSHGANVAVANPS